MPTYELVVQTAQEEHAAILRLVGPKGNELHRREVRPRGDARWQGLFDTRSYVERFAGSLRGVDGRMRTADDLLEELGEFLGREVLGPEIMAELCRSKQQRTLLLRLPTVDDDGLAAAFVRVPWELARPGLGQAPLMDRGVVVRAITVSTAAGDSLVRAAMEEDDAKDPAVRVLLVFAEAPGSRPLAMRREREALRRVFEEEIMPGHRVTLDVLCHGVTRAELEERITSRGGYHVVHWSGHGSHNALEITGEGGERSEIKGEELVSIFVEQRRSVPRVFFLSACMSGAFAARGAAGEHGDEGDKQSPSAIVPESDPRQMPGYTGTALALLRAGVPQVVAMRYSVGDDYARELARWFYKRLLADPSKPRTEEALAVARADVRDKSPLAAKRMPVDHANPLMMGQGGRWLDPPPRRSEPWQPSRPSPQPLLPGGSHELDPPGFFVGRGSMLTRVSRAWQKGGAAVTVVHGMAGLGKTSTAAEAVGLWHDRFRWVLAFQAKAVALSVEEFLRQVDLRLAKASTTYREKQEHAPYERVWLEPREGLLHGEARYEQMRVNLVEALRDEAVLLVLDNFESNLEEVASEGGYACKDLHWEALLELLAERLGETQSRVIVTSRHRPKALVGRGTEWLPLGPLPRGEAVLYVHSHERLSLMLDDAAGRGLVERMLRVGHGHPLILDRLAALSSDRRALDEALGRLEREGLGTLPELSARPSDAEAEAERRYLEDVAERSVDLLLERVSTGARRLLWVVTLAFEAVNEAMLAEVWAGRSPEDEMAEQRRMMLAMREQLPDELRGLLDAMPDELLEQLRAPAPSPVEQAQVQPLLRELYQAGLVTREESMPAKGAAKGAAEAASANVVFHELVRERVAAWMVQHPHERGPRTAEQVWVGYGQRYAAVFQGLLASGKREAAAEAGRWALVYLVRAGDFEGLGSFASTLVTGTRDPTLLGAVVAELRAVAEQVPAGRARWSVRTYLADALDMSGRADEALPLYEQAAAEAEQAEHWGDVCVIYGNWAGALCEVGQLDASKATRLRSAEAERKAGHPLVNVVASELEALRIDVMQGHAAQVLGDIEARLEQVRGWWKAHAEGKPVPEAPDRDFLGRALVGGLDIAEDANRALERWQGCLDLLEETERTKRERGESQHELACTRFNTYGPLLSLGRLEEAQRVLEGCLAEFRKAGDATNENKALSALANLWKERGDLRQAADLERHALAVCNRLPDPADRAISHENLANYLDGMGQADAPAHRLAALAYRLVSGQHERIPTTLHNLAVAKRRATTAGRTYDLPRLADTLARPAFEALHRFLTTREVDLPALQAAIDQLEAQATRRAAHALAQPSSALAKTHRGYAIALVLALVAAAWAWLSS
ncbi:CHAT domain-containing protein [Paraliomyxa miuraensis]|uniref:CHAT domain-containing protein n=2 Tax=Paraliomyxa miuraensis TaxID=376150 RepID=UPI002257439A|nr:CHAT domain-containing protein [Paraliomyxa miuraensis]MCX4239723.1 CHAT domain-containing protein [Paraliomyxa miuraensis]